MLIQKIYRNLSRILIILLLLFLGTCNFLSIGSVPVEAAILAPVQVLESQDCAGMPLLATFDAWAAIVNKDYYKAVGPCVDSSKTVFFDCTLIFITGAKASCSQKSDAGSVADCMENKNGFEKGPITNTAECKTLTQEVCAFEWDRQTTIKGCTDLFVTKPSVSTVSTEQNNDTIIEKCEPLTAQDKAQIDKKVINTKAQIVGTNYEKVCKDSTGKIFGDCTTKDGKTTCKLPLNDAAKDQLKATTGNGGDGASNALGTIFGTIANLILAILTLIVWFFGTLASWIMYILGFMFLILLRVNPAASDWIGVALAPWGVVQSLANLVILGTFVFVAFAYILNISQYKTKIDSFLTNIVIVAIAMNLTLLGCASIINIAQGIGDAFVGGYAQVKNIKNTDDYTGIASVFIGETLKSFKKVSTIRCNNVKTTSSGSGKSGATPAKTGTTQTIPQAATSAECGNDEGFSQLGQTFDIVKKDVGPNTTIFIREVVYLVIVGYGIYIFFRLLLLALIRAVTLWLLIVTSPLALVAYFSPEGFGIKKQASKWGQSFFHFTIFYPAFVFGLILAQEMTGAFNSATTVTADSIKGGPGDTSKMVIILLGGIVAVGTLKLLADFFENALKEITGAVWSGAKTLAAGGAVLAGGAAVAARGAGNIIPGISGALSKSVSKNIAALDSKIATKTEERDKLPTNSAAREKLNTEIKNLNSTKNRRQGRLSAYNSINTKSSEFRDKFVNPIANFTEMLPEYAKGAADLPKNIGASMARKRKARIDSFKEGDRLKREIFIRNNSEAFKAIGIDADEDPNSVLDGQDAQDLKDNGGKAFTDQLLKDGIKKAYSKSMGLDQKIAKGIFVKKFERILKAVNGNFDNIKDPKDKDFITDGLKQFQDDGSVMSQLAGNSTLRTAVGRAMDSQALDPETTAKLRKSSPIFITDNDEREHQVASLSPDDFREIGGYNFKDSFVCNGARQAGITDEEISKKYRNNGVDAVNEKKLRSDLKSQGMSDDAINNLTRFRRSQSNIGLTSQNDAAAKMAKKRIDNPEVTEAEARQIYDDAVALQFGKDSVINEIMQSSDMDELKIDKLNRQSSEMRQYSIANATRFATMPPQAVIEEMLKANELGKQSNKDVADTHFRVLNESAKVGAMALLERNAGTALSNLNAQTYKNAEQSGFSALSDTNFQTEIGIQSQIKNEIQEGLDVPVDDDNPENVFHVLSRDGMTDAFKQQYEAISVASLTQDVAQRNIKMKAAFKQAQSALTSNPDAIDYLQDKFGIAISADQFTADDSKVNAVRNGFAEQGVKDSEKLKERIERTARARQGGATQKNLDDAAAEEFDRKSAQSKAEAEKISREVATKYKGQGNVPPAIIFERMRADRQTSNTSTINTNPPDTGESTQTRQSSRNATQTQASAQSVVRQGNVQVAPQSVIFRGQSQQQVPNTSRQRIIDNESPNYSSRDGGVILQPNSPPPRPVTPVIENTAAVTPPSTPSEPIITGDLSNPAPSNPQNQGPITENL